MTEIKRDEKGHFVPGTKKSGGRTKGTANKSTVEIKQAIEMVYQGLGGVEAMLDWAKDNQTTFYTQIWSKLLPSALKVDASVTDFSGILEKARQRVGG